MNKKKLVILGTGFAAFSLVKKLDTKLYDTVVISPRNYFLFTPLLPSTTVGTIEFRSIIEPIRTAKGNLKYYQAACRRINSEKNTIECLGTKSRKHFTVDYDILVIAVGAVSSTFGIPGVEAHTKFLRELSEARQIRQGIIDCFELAITPGLSAADRERLLHFVVVGGGPTGVEFAAELHDFLTEDLRKWYPNLIDDVQITLVEAGKGLLSTFHERLGDYAAKTFQRARIEVLTNSPVREVREREIVLQDETHIPFGLAVWSTGNGPTTLVSSSGFERNKRQRILVDDHLHVLGQTNIFALGDCAASGLQELPATAQVAQQMGKYLAKAFNDRARGKPARPFVFKNMGMLAYIGSRKALADLPNLQGSGFGTWLFWRSAYLTKLVSTKNKCLVIFDWFKTMIFGRDISRF